MAGQSVKIEGVILSGNYAIKGMILKGGNDELGALVRLNFENSQVSFAGGKLTRKAGFKVGNCDLYMMDSSGKPVKGKIAIHKPIDRYIFNKLKIVGGLTIICGESKLSSLGGLIDINSKNELDSRVAKVIANVLGDAFKLESKMYYFNVDLKGMKFGSNTGIGLNKIDDNTLSSMLFNSIKYSYLSENIGVALYSSFVGSGFKDESLRNADESIINKLKELRINTKELRLPYYMLKGDIKFSVKDRTFGIPHTAGSRVSVI